MKTWIAAGLLAAAGPSWAGGLAAAGASMGFELSAPTPPALHAAVAARELYTYRSFNFDSKKAAEQIGERFGRNLERANYEIVEIELRQEGGFSFEIKFRARAGYESKPLEKHLTEIQPTSEAAGQALQAFVRRHAIIPLLGLLRPEGGGFVGELDYAVKLRPLGR